MRFLLLLLFLAVNCFAEGPILFGVRGGVPFNVADSAASRIGAYSSTRRFEIGPTVGVRLPFGLSVEGDALYRRQTLTFGSLAGFNASTHADSWEFPAMLKLTAGRQGVAPVFGAGVTVRHMNNFPSIPSILFSNGTSANTVGFVAGGGVRFQLGRVQVTPEVRYTRWGGGGFSQSVLNLLPWNRDEASVLVGITF